MFLLALVVVSSSHHEEVLAFSLSLQKTSSHIGISEYNVYDIKEFERECPGSSMP